MTLEGEQPPAKKARVDEREVEYDEKQPGRIKGLAQIKPEFLVDASESKVDPKEEYNDEDEGRSSKEADNGDKKGKKNKRGQNKNRNLKQGREAIKLCEQIRDTGNVNDCEFGDKCKFVHDVEMYINSKPEDIEGICPVYAAIGYCPVGLKCRWLGSHYKDGKVLVDEERKESAKTSNYETNTVDSLMKNTLQRKRYDFSKSDKIIAYLDSTITRAETDPTAQEKAKENAAEYVEAPLFPEEKKKLNLHRAKILSPLTTVGNLPYRRLMKDLGADVTYSEMAFAIPLLQGTKAEWALPKAHSSEIGGFGVQVAAPKYWQAVKATQAVSELCPDTSEINLNCGCPIDLLYKQGAGSALMENPGKLARMLKGMNLVSGDIPVTVKIRTGTKDKQPTAITLAKRLIDEGNVASITIHGRSRAQRYTKLADWDYIKQFADTVKEARAAKDDDGEARGGGVKPFVVGNGDTYSWKDWYDHVETTGVDSIMVARGALIKPWIFEEINSMQYLDKSASERLDLIKTYANYGLEHWGSDEYGVNLTRRFLCEFLSFTHRYVPVGILEYMPPKINDRPPTWKGRNELETLLASSDYKDWIKITEMFLGPAAETFEFTPKHKSNAY